MNSNIVLIGMPGCGKSTCGVLIAKSLCKSFVDTDLIIQQSEGTTLQNIIDNKGTDYFTSLEEKVILNLDVLNSVVATGGSVVYSEKSMSHLKENGIIVYLQINYHTMINRINNIKSRGILLRNGESIESMFNERESLYLKYADVIIDCNNKEIEETVTLLLEALK